MLQVTYHELTSREILFMRRFPHTYLIPLLLPGFLLTLACTPDSEPADEGTPLGGTGSDAGAPLGGSSPGGASSESGTGGITESANGGTSTGGIPVDANGGTSTGGIPVDANGGTSTGGIVGGTGGDPATGGVPEGTGGDLATGGVGAVGTGGVEPTGGAGPAGSGGAVATGSTGGTATGGIIDREQAPYPEADPSDCGESWRLVDNVCCAQYCADDDRSESCTECGGNESQLCIAVDAQACKSGKWPETHAVSADEPWHYSRSTHFGLTAAGACAYGLYSLCSSAIDSGSEFQERCTAFCTAYPDLCADPPGVTLRGNYAAPQGNYYTQFWPSLPGDLDNYLACGECFEVVHTHPDGTDYQPGETGYTPPLVLQVVDSCPCAPNSKWCCGAGRNHCGEVSDYTYGCPLPAGVPDPAPDRDPLPDESIHLDLSSIAMARLQSGEPMGTITDGVIPIRYRRVPCPVVGNTYIWLHPAGEPYWFSLSVVNSAGLGSIVSVEAQLPSGEWIHLQRDMNYTSSRPQERYGAWMTPQGVGPFELPVSLRLTSPSGEAIVAAGVIQSWEPADPAMRETYYIDTGVQFQ